jgi:hypothetical protein
MITLDPAISFAIFHALLQLPEGIAPTDFSSLAHDLEYVRGWTLLERRWNAQLYEASGLLLTDPKVLAIRCITRQIQTAILLTSPTNIALKAEKRTEEAIRILSVIGLDKIEIDVCDPLGLWRNDQSVCVKFFSFFSRLNIGGRWRISPIIDRSEIFLWHVPQVAGRPLLEAPIAQTRPFIVSLP